MDEDLKEVVGLLKKCFPVLVEKPEIMIGCDISDEEIKDIKLNKKLSLEVLEHVAGDDFFETYNDEINLNEEEASKVGKFLSRSALHFKDELKKEISCLEVEDGN